MPLPPDTAGPRREQAEALELSSRTSALNYPITLEQADQSGLRWTEDEDRIILKRLKDSAWEVALALGRVQLLDDDSGCGESLVVLLVSGNGKRPGPGGSGQQRGFLSPDGARSAPWSTCLEVLGAVAYLLSTTKDAPTVADLAGFTRLTVGQVAGAVRRGLVARRLEPGPVRQHPMRGESRTYLPTSRGLALLVLFGQGSNSGGEGEDDAQEV